MTALSPPISRAHVPPRALALSIAALLVPLLASAVEIPRLAEVERLLWLLALVPPFLFAYYRGWQGAATALAGGMAVLSISEAIQVGLGGEAPDPVVLTQAVCGYVTVSLGIGWVTELLHRARLNAETLAYRDPVTLLPNRRYARLRLDRMFEHARSGARLSVVFFDIDHFKAYNDAHGHLLGDDALVVFGEVLRRACGPHDTAARYGGEEFIMISDDARRSPEAMVADTMRELHLAAASLKSELTVSAGIAEYGAGMQSADELLEAADRALYNAKAQGRNCCQRYQPPVARLLA